FQTAYSPTADPLQRVGLHPRIVHILRCLRLFECIQQVHKSASSSSNHSGIAAADIPRRSASFSTIRRFSSGSIISRMRTMEMGSPQEPLLASGSLSHEYVGEGVRLYARHKISR